MVVSVKYEVKCSVCGRSSGNLLDFKCVSCGQPLDVQLSLDFETGNVRSGVYTVWRYIKFFPYVTEKEIVTLGEGWTPLVKISENVYFKLENLNPTGSFKDRGSTVLISALQNRLKKIGGYVSEDSSGNAGASLAAYGACAGLKTKIYVPESVSGPKFNQIQFYNAEVIKIAGSRALVAEEAQKPEKNKHYVGHILHPLFRDGIRSLAYEIAENFDWQIPERVYLPVSAGTLLLGLIEGFKHLIRSDVVPSMPKIIACQTRQVSPLFHKLKGVTYTPPETVNSVADALVSTNPPLLELMLQKLKESKGDAVIVEENEILHAFKELAAQGFFVEPSSAVSYAAYEKQLKEKEIRNEDKAVVILTGSGLKTTLRPS